MAQLAAVALGAAGILERRAGMRSETAPGRALRWGVLAVAWASAGWLLTSRALTRTVEDWAGEGASLAFGLLVGPAFVLALLLALTWAARSRGHPGAHRPLLVLGGALALAVAIPFGPLRDEVDFWVHARSRAEIVALAHGGPLGPPCPMCELVPLPRPFPTSVANGGGQRQLVVWAEGGVTTVVFFRGGGDLIGALLREGSALLWRSDGGVPAVPDRHLPTARDAQPLGDGWYRVTFG